MVTGMGATDKGRNLRKFDWRSPVSVGEQQELRVPCHLKRQMPCCFGKGYKVSPADALTVAALCSCVKECPGCLGRAQQLDGGFAKPCLVPGPNVVVNLINAAMIPARYADASVDRFQNFTGNGRQVVQDIAKWRAKFLQNQGRGLIIEGPVGVGKTFLLASLAKDFAEKGLSVRFTDFFQLLGELKAGFSQGKADATQLAPLIDVDVLLIDELGKGRNNDFELTVLDQLICGRYNQNKTIVATTNYRLKGGGYDANQDFSQSQFAADRFQSLEPRIGQRIFSRLREMTQFTELTGDDWRREETRYGS